MTADPTSTSAGLAAALRFLDAYATAGAAWCDEPTFVAVFAVARAAVAKRHGGIARAIAYAALTASEHQPGWKASIDAADNALCAAERAEDAAVARLVALATGEGVADGR